MAFNGRSRDALQVHQPLTNSTLRNRRRKRLLVSTRSCFLLFTVIILVAWMSLQWMAFQMPIPKSSLAETLQRQHQDRLLALQPTSDQSSVNTHRTQHPPKKRSIAQVPPAIAARAKLLQEQQVITKTFTESLSDMAGPIQSLIRGQLGMETPPFRLKRSMPQPPSDFITRETPNDVLGPHGIQDWNSMKPLQYTLRSRYHGVLLDAGRHYFPLDWIKRMIRIISLLQYNALHFRLTDDQAWNVQLKSQPGLAHPTGVHGSNRTYTPDEIRELVAYGKQYGVTLWPEINVPGHGGAWAGIPGMIVECPEFICYEGYGIPLNVTHPNFRSVLTDVLREIIDIFDNPPFLHLGGDELNLAKGCFEEVGAQMSDFAEFEQTLAQILQTVNYPPEQVIRWEGTGHSWSTNRTGSITQYWFRVPGDTAPWSGPYFASTGLYMDANTMDMAWNIFLQARKFYHVTNLESATNQVREPPLGLLVGTFELGTEFWYDRNVVGRLLAVTMGASLEVYPQDGEELNDMYKQACLQVGFEESLCSHYGAPLILQVHYIQKWEHLWDEWKTGICEWLTTESMQQVYKPYGYLPPTQEEPRRVRSVPLKTRALEYAWDRFATNVTNLPALANLSLPPFRDEPDSQYSLLQGRLVNSLGVIVDQTWEEDVPFDAIKSLFPTLHSLGFRLLQLRMLGDFAFGYNSVLFEKPASLQKRPWKSDLEAWKPIVQQAHELGIATIPEIAISTDAGGLYELGFNMRCPQYTCEVGSGVQNVTSARYLPLIYSIIREVLEISTSGMIHLGADERRKAKPCFDEVGIDVSSLDIFERKLGLLLGLNGISPDRFIRWGNQEQKVHSGRLGSTTQCRPGSCNNVVHSSGSWFGTVDLMIGGPWSIYHTTRAVALRKPQALFGELGSRDPELLESSTNQMSKRMLAFAMGTLDLDELERDAFEKNFVKLCIDVLDEPQQDCAEFAKAEQDAEMLFDRRSKDMCDERTLYITRNTFLPKPWKAKVAVE